MTESAEPITKTYPVSGIPDEKGSTELMEQIKAVPGIKTVNFDAEDRLVEVTYYPDQTDEQNLIAVIGKLGNTLFTPEEPFGLDNHKEGPTR